MSAFDHPKTAISIAAVLVIAIVALIVIQRLTTERSTAPYAADAAHGRCAVARQALDAFDQGRPPPAEWIQDRAAAAEAVRNCDAN